MSAANFSLADSQYEAASTHRSDIASARKGTKARSADDTLRDIERVLKQAHDLGRDVGGWGGLFPLHRAAERGDIDALSTHVHKGYAINERDGSGRTPCHYAVLRDRHDCLHNIVFLLAGDANAVDGSGLAAIHHAAQRGSVKCLGMLLQAGVHVDCADAHSRTPLMMACSGGHDAAVRLLLKNGASLMLRDTKGKSAMEHAKGDEVVELIKSSTAGQGVNTRAESHNSNGSFTSTMHAVPPLLLSSVVQAGLIQQSRFSRARSSAHQLLQTIERMSALERGNGIVWSAEQLLLLDSLEQLTSGALDTSNSLFKACHPYE
jgi:ankyrin repeat protein